ncbi:DMT family transporter [Haladaptatus cibarius]|uniref:DMT family transporter n=1 Tax=Haladaptatus cibarius TaxID=453847 RepID=UPI000679BCAC|nr:EamA family transporter [Haladaptatus cibarius]
MQSFVNRRFVIIGLFGVLATLWGFSFLAISVGLESLEPILFAAFRYDIAAILLLGYAVYGDSTWRPTDRSNAGAVLAGGVFLVGANAFLFIGQQTVASGMAAILQSLLPIMTSLWAVGLLPEERISATDAVGIVLGFIGVGLIIRPNPANLLGTDVVGRLLIFVQVTGVALGGVLIQRFEPTLDKAALSGWSMFTGGLLLHVVSTSTGEAFSFPTGVRSGAAVAYLGIFATAIAFLIYFTLLDVRGALETSLVSYLIPIVATIVGVVVLGESITSFTIVGFVVVFTGFVLLKRRDIADVVTGAT